MVASFFIILTAYLLFLLYKYVLKPYLAILWYKKQGIPIFHFFPFIGFFKIFDDDFTKYNDSFYRFKLLKNTKGQIYKIYSMNFNSNAVLFIVDPQLIKECLLNQTEILYKDPIFIKNLSRFFGNNNIIFSEGMEWKKSRKLITKSFTFDFLKDNISKIITTTEERLEALKFSKDIDLENLLQNITSQIFMRIFFKTDLSEALYKGKPLSYWIVFIMNKLDRQSTEIYYIIFGEKFFKLGLRASDRELNRYIIDIRKIFIDYVKSERLKENSSSNTLLSNFLKNRNLLKEDGGCNLDERITNEMMILFFAGTDTTSNCLLNALHSLSKNSDCLEKLIVEIDLYIKDKKKIDFDSVNQLDYLTAVIKETLRMFGPGNLLIHRIANKNFRIGEYIIKKNTVINFPLVSNYFDGEVFSDPFLFKPERWLISAKKNLNHLDPYIYIPFSAGPRNCIGQHLAMLEAKVILIKFLKKYRYEIKNINVKMELKFLYAPSEPLLINIQKR